MKKAVGLVIIIFMVLVAFGGCKEPKESIPRYTIEMGREVFLLDDNDYAWTESREVALPVGYRFFEPIDDNSFVCCQVNSDSERSKYGIMDYDGKVLVECKYDSISSSGKFLYGEYYENDEAYKSEVYYSDGVKLLSTDSHISLKALDDEFCALYYDGKSQIFDKNGCYYLKDNTAMSDTVYYSICDGYLFGYDTESKDWFIWQLIKNFDGETPYGFAVLKNVFSSVSCIYSVAYLGDYNFLVVETYNNNNDYDYYETINGTKYYVLQKTCILNIQTGVSEYIDLEYPILSIINHYSPTLTYEQRLQLNIKKGYSEVNAGIISSNGERTGYRFFVIDNKGNFVIRYPEKMSATAMRFIDGYGFAGGAGEGYSAALYYMNCEPIWQRTDREYYAQSFSSGRYVLSCSIGDKPKYGVLDSDGVITVDFKYSYISPYVANKALYRDENGEIGILNADGQEIYQITDYVAKPSVTSYGMYCYSLDEKVGLKLFDGSEIVEAKYSEMTFFGKNEDRIIAVFTDGDIEKVVFIK